MVRSEEKSRTLGGGRVGKDAGGVAHPPIWRRRMERWVSNKAGATTKHVM